MFVFSKGKPKSHNMIKDRPNSQKGKKASAKIRNADGTTTLRKSTIISEFGKRKNVWLYNTGYGSGQKDKTAYKHPATFPEKLAEDHILSWSNKGDIILDPFFGSGTTGKMAKLNNRNYIGFDTSQEYCDMAEERCK